MSNCCCDPKKGNGLLAGVGIAAVALTIVYIQVILTALLVLLLTILAAGILTAGVMALLLRSRLVWRRHAARYTVEQVNDDRVLEGEIVQGGIDGARQAALETGDARGIPFGFGELSDGQIVSHSHTDLPRITHHQALARSQSLRLRHRD